MEKNQHTTAWKPTAKIRYMLPVLSLLLVLSACTVALPENTAAPGTEQPAGPDTTETSAVTGTKPDATEASASADTQPGTGETVSNTQFSEPQTWYSDAALTRFLTDVNYNGSILPGGELDAPGTPPDVELIPPADQSMLGQTVSIILAQEQQAIPFCYVCDKTTGTERLAVILENVNIPLLIVFETDLGGVSGLCGVIRTEREFSATILAMVNISFYPEAFYAYNACTGTYGLNASEIIDISAPAETEHGVYLGIVGTAYSRDGELWCMLKGTGVSMESDGLASDIEVFQRIFSRFGIEELINIA